MKQLKKATDKMQENIDYEELLTEAFAKGKKPPLKYSTKEMTTISMLLKYHELK